ncbi:hypothetical protein [Chryseobacterium sp. SL1]|uniref:glycosyl-4,4'-diaponeurosporenoate acyltransferase CrtO family protein n=1 Tax=Chryseobacterium sp. SL1 TaxID=2995159 RepID=UPI00227457A6|nr:hypothetical protein [Chryseobacterium sp. SL1]MCY1660227.1 hypothetical protein [Chryseobacterium sp. SL1]
MTALIRKTNFYHTTLSNLNFVKNEMTNKIIGVGIVKWIVKNTFFKFLNQKLKFDRKMNISDIKNIRNEMTKAEIDHLFAFIFVFIIVIFEMYNQKYFLALIMLLTNITMNLFPSLIQQQNKRRIDKLIFKFDRKEGQIKRE